VRFLNSVGGGIVRRFQNKDIVLVEEEDGFETPVLLKECVVVEAVSKETNLPEKKPVFMPPSAPIIIRQEPETEEEYDYEETPEGERITVFLSFVPENIKQLQTTSYYAYLINDCNYFLHYNVATIDKEANSQYQGVIEPNTKFQIATISKEQLNDWEHVSVQFFAFKKKAYAHKSVVDVELKINPVRFYKLHSFTENDYFRQEAMMFSIIENDGFVSEINIDPQQLKEALIQKKEDGRRPRIQHKSVANNGIIEIDLHIDELIDNTTGMSNADMLEYQLAKFNEVLQENRNKKGQKIVFVHGKGDGVLRKELLKQLKNKYSSYYVQDASFREYGFGATMVTIK
jgi:hypothetical protein